LKIFDVSMTLSIQTPEWPGDTPFSYEMTWTKEESGSVNVGKISTSTHIGTHIDAPFHFDNEGDKVHEIDLERYIGPAVVIDCTGKKKVNAKDLSERLTDFPAIVILKTNSWDDRLAFPKSIPYLDPEIGDFLKRKGVKLLGVDLPSVDAIDSKELITHHALHKNDVYILEGLILDDIKEGTYRLVALPLKIEGSDGSPVRAILIKD
jgi:arylformamidase